MTQISPLYSNNLSSSLHFCGSSGGLYFFYLRFFSFFWCHLFLDATYSYMVTTIISAGQPAKHHFLQSPWFLLWQTCYVWAIFARGLKAWSEISGYPGETIAHLEMLVNTVLMKLFYKKSPLKLPALQELHPFMFTLDAGVLVPSCLNLPQYKTLLPT